MVLAYSISQTLIYNCNYQFKALDFVKIKLSSDSDQAKPNGVSGFQAKKRCLRCKTLYSDADNSPTSCSFHGHATGEKGLFALAPPHQGIDGDWTDGSGVIVYKWNNENNRPNTGRANWKKRVAAKNMMKMHHLVFVDGMSHTMTASLYIRCHLYFLFSIIPY
ncbi:hypothetical protein ES332_A12G109200v1 [Gossypium tomentosum]|uniref:Uncharacterized protein n=1 Tax=Gossypium tomentosum TaxID=34277 RepID=A0A5D2MVC0_GOSTO|nr:hypothetical protein ES332_A12G109200v1 [Gossypium tomentosum]